LRTKIKSFEEDSTKEKQKVEDQRKQFYDSFYTPADAPKEAEKVEDKSNTEKIIHVQQEVEECEKLIKILDHILNRKKKADKPKKTIPNKGAENVESPSEDKPAEEVNDENKVIEPEDQTEKKEAVSDPALQSVNFPFHQILFFEAVSCSVPKNRGEVASTKALLQKKLEYLINIREGKSTNIEEFKKEVELAIIKSAEVFKAIELEVTNETKANGQESPKAEEVKPEAVETQEIKVSQLIEPEPVKTETVPTEPDPPKAAEETPEVKPENVTQDTPKEVVETPKTDVVQDQPPVSPAGEYHLEVTVVAGNAKRMDPKAYGVVDRSAWIRLELGGVTKETKRVEALTLDPTWDETFEFTVSDPQTQELKTWFFLGEVQIGQQGSFKLNELICNKHQFKAFPVFGGKIDLTLRPRDFGQEDKPVEYSFMDDMF